MHCQLLLLRHPACFAVQQQSGLTQQSSILCCLLSQPYRQSCQIKVRRFLLPTTLSLLLVLCRTHTHSLLHTLLHRHTQPVT
jgi:hypothetical protein